MLHQKPASHRAILSRFSARIVSAMRPVRRPSSILGLLLHLARSASPEASRRLSLVALAILGAVVLVLWFSARGTSRVGTFNIENYPKSDRQEAGAFDAIRSLDAVAIGVQEITDTAAFEASARRRLGEPWRFVFADRGSRAPHTGTARMAAAGQPWITCSRGGRRAASERAARARPRGARPGRAAPSFTGRCPTTAQSRWICAESGCVERYGATPMVRLFYTAIRGVATARGPAAR